MVKPRHGERIFIEQKGSRRIVLQSELRGVVLRKKGIPVNKRSKMKRGK